MKIKNISCSQFAGMRNKSISLSEGVNVIFGANESGKSTIANLLSRTFFQRARIDARSDKDFKAAYFPSDLRDKKSVGDFIDGKVEFETKNGVFVLSKEWGKDWNCRLETPDGMMRDADKITEILKNELVYGEGVYNEILFSSQKNSDFVLQTLLDASKKTDTKREITDCVSRAFAQSDNVSIDAIEAKIAERIAEIEGEHWDSEQNIPKRNSKGNRWSKGIGSILKAYYAMKDAQGRYDEIIRLENAADNANAVFTEKDRQCSEAQADYNEFQKFAIRIAQRNAGQKNIKRLQDTLSKLNRIIDIWPFEEESLEKAVCLRNELASRNITDEYENAVRIMDMYAAAKKELEELGQIDSEDMTILKKAVLQLETLERKLGGINLLAKMKLENGHNMTVTSVRTGEEIPFNSDLTINEAVVLKIPGVLEMQLSPVDTDIDEVNSLMTKYSNIRNSIYEKYNISSVTELEQLIEKYNECSQNVANIGREINNLRMPYEELQAEFDKITSIPRDKNEIRNDILSLCGQISIDSFIASKETIINSYKEEYTSVKLLKADAFDVMQEIEKASSVSGDDSDIPEEYRSVGNPEEYLELLKNAAEKKQAEKNAAFAEKSNAQNRLEAYRESLEGEPKQEIEAAKRVFDEEKETLAHWKHIQEVFYRRKELLNNNPMQDIADSFERYLNIISGGRITTEFPEGDKLNFGIFSAERAVDYPKLSEGTKETVLLAFRLAVIEHLFPNGGAVAVFDDPFTDMDSVRTKQSIEIVKEFAKKNQVIFLTCKSEYLEEFKENIVEV